MNKLIWKNLISSFLILFSCTIAAKEPRIMEWDQLMPPGYVESLIEEATKNQSKMKDLFSFDDSSEEAQTAYEELKAKLSSAPIVPELNDEFVKLAGFVVPLDFDFDTETFKQFLLVPYYGACIHVPPPPSNQIVHISSQEPLDQEWLDYAVWATGTLKTKSVYSEYGFAGYSMPEAKLDVYKEDQEFNYEVE